MKMSFRFVFFLSFPIMFGITSIAKNFVPVFFGAGYDKVTILIGIMSPVLVFMGIGNVMGTQYLLPTKRQKEYTISVSIGVVVNFILNYILINLYEAIGAAIATVLSELVVVLIQIGYVKKDIDFKEIFKSAWKYLVAGAVMYVVCLIVKEILGRIPLEKMKLMEKILENTDRESSYLINCLYIIVQMIVGVISYFGMLILFKDEYIYTFLNKIKEKFTKRVKQEI